MAIKSQLDVLNMALSYIGKLPVESLDDPAPFVDWFKLNYQTVRDSVIIDSEWNFAVERFLVNSDTDIWLEPPFEYDYAYALDPEER